ncbi:hypothetical protein [Asticcacaulis taihuensis]|uniref:hypothetical protein n=1 Tax=Asticcacaulis taihuensis TaxID=260084 RepID=UPI003F7C1DD4
MAIFKRQKFSKTSSANFQKLPPLVRRGLERSKISAITLMSDAAAGSSDSIDLRAQVFERLNTGGERLNTQELRNSLYSGPFNNLIVHLAGTGAFTEAWDIPSHKEHILSDGSPDSELKENNLFKRMIDVEIVLRFFAFKDEKKITGSVRAMLDGAMKLYRNVNESEIADLREQFQEALTLAHAVFERDVFRLPASGTRSRGLLSRPLFDAQMVAFYRQRHLASDIIANRKSVKSAVLALADKGSKTYELIVGRANTAIAIKNRIKAVEEAILGAL